MAIATVRRGWRNWLPFGLAVVMGMAFMVAFATLVSDRTKVFNNIRKAEVELSAVRGAIAEYTAAFALLVGATEGYSDSQIRRAKSALVASSGRISVLTAGVIEGLRDGGVADQTLDLFVNPFDSVLTGVQFIEDLTVRMQSEVPVSDAVKATAVNYLAYRLTDTINRADSELVAVQDKIIAENILVAYGIGFIVVALSGGLYLLVWRPQMAAVAAARDAVDAASRTDKLTGLPVEGEFMARADAALASGRAETEKDVLIVIACRAFDRIGAAFGATVADAVIAEAANRLARHVPDNAITGRLRRSQFAILMRDEQSLARSLALVRTLREQLEEAYAVKDVTIRPDFVFGVAGAPDHGKNATDVAAAAWRAVREAMAFNGLPVRPSTPEDVQRINEETAITRSLLSDDFSAVNMVFMPVYSVADGQLNGVEALGRWTNKDGKDIEAAKFLPLAIGAGKMPALGRKLHGDALRAWAQVPAAIRLQARLGLNIHATEMPAIRNGALDELIRNSGLSWNDITLEITGCTSETSIGRDNRKWLAHVRAAGAKICLDDFGGPSQSAGLPDLTIADEIKIARHLVSAAEVDPAQAKVLQSVILAARSMGVRSTAKGLETFTAAEQLIAFKCDAAQGFLFGEPVNALGLLALPARTRAFAVSAQQASA